MPGKTEETKPTVYRFVGKGNFTVVLAGTYRRVLHNDLGEPIGKEVIPGKRLVFHNGVAETTDPDVVTLIKKTAHWGNDVMWHPSSMPPEEADNKETKARADEIANYNKERIKRRQKGVEMAREGRIPRE